MMCERAVGAAEKVGCFGRGRARNREARSCRIAARHRRRSGSFMQGEIMSDRENRKRQIRPFWHMVRLPDGVFGVEIRFIGHRRVTISEGEKHGCDLESANQRAVATRTGTVSARLERSMKNAGEPRTILMIEDEHSVRAIVAIYLENAGFKVLEAADADEAMAVWHQQMGMIDLVLSDVLLSDVDASEVIRRFRDERPDLKVVLMSGGIPAPSENYRQDIGAFDFLRKPFTAEELMEVVGASMGETFDRALN